MVVLVVKIDLNKLIPKKYNDFIFAFLKGLYTHFALYGGRGSVKSTIAALLLVLCVLYLGCAVAIRRFKNSLKDSVFQECLTAIDRLGLSEYFTYTISPLQINCTLTGYSIYFRGLDDPQKIKSLKAKKGQFRLCVAEECQEIETEAKIRSVIQTLGRGGESFSILYVFNPPNLKSHWVNQKLRETTDWLLSLLVNYTDVPKSWLGQSFLEEAERLKSVDIDLYNHEYLGEVSGYKGLVFKNVEAFTADKTKYKTLLRGLDFGLAKDGDPTAYAVCNYDDRKKELYIVDEWYKQDSTYPEIAKAVLKENKHNFTVFCDNADSGGIKQLQIEGVKRAKGCKKGKVDNGIAWLRGLNKIYIDSEKCPETYREFTEYTYVLQKSTGDYILSEKDNHSVDAVRYALSDYIKY
jgi:PBSX family phage terminase large subunit